jgi:hypothetical protein
MHETGFLIALGLTLAVSSTVAAVLHGPLRRMLGDGYKKDQQTVFWVRFAEVLLLLIPLTLLAVGGAVESRRADSLLFQVIHFAKWSLIGLVGAIFTLAAMIGSVLRPMMSSVWVAPHQVTDLERLIAKLDQIRARELMRNMTEPLDLLAKREQTRSHNIIQRPGDPSNG